MNAAAHEIPIMIINEDLIANKSQKDLILQAIHKALRSKVEDREKYQDMRVEIDFNKDGWPERLIVHTTYKGLYLFETDELHLDSKGQITGTNNK